jgi:hypothetical protein
MFSGRLRFLCLSAIVLLVGSAAALCGQTDTYAAPIVAEGVGKGTIALDGKWQFHLGDNAAWASPDLDDSRWELITADKPWGAQGHSGYAGFAWYRRHISIALAPGASTDIAMLLPPIEDVAAIYWNGGRVAQSGEFPPRPVWYFRAPPTTLGIGPMRSGVLAVRVYKAPLGSFDSGLQGGFTATPLIGSPEAIAALKGASDFRWLQRNQLRFGIDSLWALLSVLAFLAWLRDRRQWLLFWLAGFTISPVAIDCLLNFRIHLPTNLALGFAQPFFGLIQVCLWNLLILILRLEDSRRFVHTVRILAAIELAAFSLDGILVLFIVEIPASWSPATQWADGIFTAIFTLLQVIPLILVIYAVLRRRKLTPERWLVAICAFISDAIPTLRSALEQGSRYTHWTFGEKINAPLFIVNGNSISAQLISATLLLFALVIAIYRYLAEERLRQSAIEQEFKSARELQQILIPEDPPEIAGYTLTSAYKPAAEVGGDFFQIVALENGATLVVLGDVSGKGLKAAMAVSLIVGAIRTFAEISNSPAKILDGLNRRLDGRLNGGFATAVALRLDANGDCTVSNAGHLAPFLNDRELSLPGELPLGLVASTTYEERRFHLGEFEHLALFTDGLLEARSAAGELYGFERMQTLFSARPTADEAMQAAVAFGQDDDITVLTLTRLAAGAGGSGLKALGTAPDLASA